MFKKNYLITNKNVFCKNEKKISKKQILIKFVKINVK